MDRVGRVGRNGDDALLVVAAIDDDHDVKRSDPFDDENELSLFCPSDVAERNSTSKLERDDRRFAVQIQPSSARTILWPPEPDCTVPTGSTLVSPTARVSTWTIS